MKDDSRTVLKIAGDDPRGFLQDLVTNDLAGKTSALVYTALLTPQGKYLADFFVVPDGDAILIDIDQSLAGPVMTRLQMYKLRRALTIEQTDRSVSRGLGPAPEGAFDDPRHPSLGWRGYDGQIGAPVDWDAIHVAACIPRSGIELGPDTFILEAGFERLAGVDFRKGCYVGQEVTARMKHKTALRKGLAIVDVDGAAQPGTEITANGKAAGVLYSQSDGRGIAYLRFDRAEGPMQADGATVTYSGDTPEP